MKRRPAWRIAFRALLVAAVLATARPIPAADIDSAVPFGETVGVNTHYGAGREPVNRGALERLHAAGVRSVRNDLDWASIERERGAYDFAGAGVDDFVAAAEDVDLRILFILDYGNTLYGPAQAVVSDEGRAAFAAYASAAAQRYGGRGHMWEVWNEPNLPQFWSADGAKPDPVEYAHLVDAVIPALRAADPGGTILIGATFMGLPEIIPFLGGVEGMDFLQRLFATGVLERVDGVSAHFYRAEPPESVAETVAGIRAAMADAGRVVPLWSGEWGYSTYDPDAPPTGLNFLPAVTEDEQASLVARMLLTNYSLGLRGSVWFEDRDAANPSPGDIEAHWGLMHDDLSPKPSYDALATAAHLLADATVSRILVLGSEQHGVELATTSEPITALWTEGAATWRLVARQEGARLLSRDGVEVTPRRLEDGHQVRLHGDDGPLYLVGGVEVLPSNSCAGDCRGDGTVSVDELVAGVRIALGAAPIGECAILDTDDDGEITVDELVAGVDNALAGCPE